MTSKNAQCSSRSGFWILKISREVRILKQSQSALFGSISHMKTLFVFTCVMNVWNQSIQAFVTGSGPFLWLIVQVCSLIMEYQVSWYMPSFYILEQFESILVTIHQQISFLLLWSDGHRCMEWILCRVVESSCSPTHNIVFSHLFAWLSMSQKKYEYFERTVISPLHPRKFWIQTWFCNCQQYLCLFHIVFEYTPRKHDQGRMLALSNQPLCLVVSTSDQDFVSFQPIWCHPHTQTRIFLFHNEQRDIPNLEFSPSHVQ